MLIVADENIPMIADALAGVGEVRLVPGRSMAREQVKYADVLLVRSVTKVNAALLDGSRVRFVGTATIGTDHLDIPYLAGRGIEWASAQGSNADSVVEYVVAALLQTCVRHGMGLEGLTLGIVGCGNIGSRLARVAPALGMKVLMNDPPRERRGDPGPWTDLYDLLAHCDVVSFHVPLIREGPDRTVALMSYDHFEVIRPSAILVNTSRGEVVDGGALLHAIDRNQIATVLLDVFENEPRIDRTIVSIVEIATPHIAGYSHDGKINGTRMMASAVCRHFGVPSAWNPALAPPPNTVIELDDDHIVDNRRWALLASAVAHAYPIMEDDQRLRAGVDLSDDEWARHFDRLRKEYPVRREFPNYTVRAPHRLADEAAILGKLGFRVEVQE